MIKIKDLKTTLDEKDSKQSKEAKDKIQLMIEEEKINETKMSSEEKQHTKKLQAEKVLLIRYSAIAVILFLFALGLFYAAFSAKTEMEFQHQQEIKIQANNELNSLIKQASSGIKKQTQAFISILNDKKQIPFDSASKLENLKSRLKSSLSDAIAIQIIPSDYEDDEIIDHPDMGYTFLFLLNELKSLKNTANLTRFEVYKGKAKDNKLLLIHKVMNKDETLAYIVANLSIDFINHLFTGTNFNNRYFEIIQQHSSASLVLTTKGNVSLKSLPIVIFKKLDNTAWNFKYWSGEQKRNIALVQYWLAFLYLTLSILAILAAIILFIITHKKYRLLHPVQLVSEQKTKKDESYLSKLQSDQIANNEIHDKELEERLKIANNIFRAYDIRGVVGEFINTDVFRKIAHIIAKEMRNKQQNRIAIACDGRMSSPQLIKAVIDTLLDEGVDVIDIGMMSSPILYFAALNKANGNGLMITASHNTENYNGMKIMLAGHSYAGDDLQLLKQQFLLDESSDDKSNDAAGKKIDLDIIDEYIDKVSHNIKLSRPMKIVIDSGNGVTGKFVSALFKQLNCHVTVLNEKVDGHFPAHVPDPSRPENMAELAKKVVELKADIGFAFDGDGDRIGLVTSDGQIVWPDRILMFLTKEILSRNKGATVLYDVKSTKNLVNFIQSLGGEAIMCQSGHSLMKNKLKQTGALIAGEMSGHIFIKDRWYGFDDACYVAARILEILSIDLRKSSHIFAELPNAINTPEILIETTQAPAIMKKVSMETSCFDGGNIITIDGVRVEYPDGWGLVRSSNTSDKLTLRFEAENEAALQRIANVFKESLLAASPDLKLPF